MALSFLPEKKGDRRLILISLLALILLVYGLIFYNPQDDSVRGEEIGFIQTDGAVRRRHARSLLWTDIRGEERLYLRDFVYTPKGQTATVYLPNNQVFHMQPDTLIQFDSLSLEGIEILLIAGMGRKKKLFLKPGNAKLLAYLPSLEPYKLRQEEFRQRLLQRLSRKPKLLDPKDPDLQNYALNRLEHFEVDLLSPKRGKKIGLLRTAKVDTLWTPVPLKKVVYEIQVSRKPDFVQLASYETVKNDLMLEFRDKGVYHWRVVVRRGKERLISEPSSFSVSRSGGSIAILDRLPTGTAAQYTAEVSKSPTFKKILTNRSTSGRTCTASGLGKGTYYCRIRSSSTQEMIREYSFTVP